LNFKNKKGKKVRMFFAFSTKILLFCLFHPVENIILHDNMMGLFGKQEKHV
jgi:hypothetical protein